MEKNLVIKKEQIRDCLFDLLIKTPNIWGWSVNGSQS